MVCAGSPWSCLSLHPTVHGRVHQAASPWLDLCCLWDHWSYTTWDWSTVRTNNLIGLQCQQLTSMSNNG